MRQFIETLFTKTWWQWNPSDGQWFSVIYHWFNILEGVSWIVFAALVFQRYVSQRNSSVEIAYSNVATRWPLRNDSQRNSSVEIAYSVAFLAFAATDFLEAWEQSSWLIWLKLLNLIALLWLRRIVMQRCYPSACALLSGQQLSR